MTRTLSLLLLTNACAGPRAEWSNLPDEGERVPASATFGSTLTAEGSGTSGSWTGYRRADMSCTNAGGSYAVDCSIDFMLAQAADGTATLSVVDFDPSNGWERDNIVEVLQDRVISVGTDGAPVATQLTGTTGYTWDVEVEVTGDTLSIEAHGTYSNLGSCSGSRITMSCAATYEDPSLSELIAPTLTLAELAADDIVIHEVLADPTACGDSHAEWIEIRNDAGSAVDLTGLTVEDAAGNRSILEPALVLEDGGLAVLARGTLDTFCDPGLDPDAGLDGTISLNNGGDTLLLYAGAVLLDSVAYGAVGAGVSSYLDADGSWCTGMATPGEANGDCVEEEETVVTEAAAGDVLVTEMMMNPSACADEYGEWVEITNVSAVSVDLTGLELHDAGETVGRVSTTLMLAPGESAWFGRSSAARWAGTSTPDAWYGSSPALNNGGDTIALVLGGVELDQTPLLVPAAGVAWQRDPNSGAWCAATETYGGGERGTPGTVNDVCP